MKNNSPALNLNQDAIRRANNASMFEPGASYAAEAAAVYAKLLPLFADKPEYTDQQREYLQRREGEWKNLVENAYNDIIQKRGQFVPVTVAGPSNYPVAKMQKIAERNLRASAEWNEKLQRFEANTHKELLRLTPHSQMIERYRKGYNEPISSDDPQAVEKLSARLDFLKENHEHMKAFNAWHRKHGTCVGFTGIAEDSARTMDNEIASACSWEKNPYPAYMLTNNKSNITRLEERLRQAQRARSAAQKEGAMDSTRNYNGFSVVQNTTLQRLQILFDGKPCEATRATLKRSGFHWSPREKAWQRLLNSNATQALQRILPVLETTNA